MTGALDSYAAEWERARQCRERVKGGAVEGLREEAWRRFLSLGFPTTHDEDWRFTSVAPIAERPFTVAAPLASDPRDAEVGSFRLPGEVASELVFVDGHYVPALSRVDGLPPGFRVESLNTALTADPGAMDRYLARIAPFERHAFVALNTAFLDEGAFIHVPSRVDLRHPILLLFLSAHSSGAQPAMVHPRVLVVVGASSRCSVVETYAGPARLQYFTNAVTEIVVGENAAIEHYTLQHESPEAAHVHAIHVQAERSAACSLHSISAGGALVRNDVVAVLNGEGVECTLNGLYVADGQQLVDNHTTIDHARPHCGSREIYKGILADRARGVFNGKIIVRPDAQKTDAKQTNRALLLSESAQINTKPQLEIFANDVKCTHGAAVGQLDDEALFYLRSRGLSHGDARQLLIHAFAADVLSRLPLEAVRAGVEQRVERQLAKALPTAA
jgi:Fe-S cluster assembly protein SufD